MIFCIDVRRRICNPYNKWMEYVNMKTHFKTLSEDDDETNSEIKEKLKDVLKILEEVEAIKRQETRDVIHDFESDFVKEVKNNKFLYGD